MTSSKMLSRQLVNHLLNSILKDHSKCQICLSTKLATTQTQKLSTSSVALSSQRTGASRSQLEQSALRLRLLSAAKSNRRGASTQALNQQQVALLEPQEERAEEENESRELVRDNPGESFRYSELAVIKCPSQALRPKPAVDKLEFGKDFTDHMFRVDWDKKRGWSRPMVSKLHPLELHPAAKVFHYGLCAFEGAKAFRGDDNKIRFFRLDQNLKRLAQSARRLALPDFDQHELAQCIHRLVHLDQDWIPKISAEHGEQQLTSLYVRPYIMGTEPSLGVASSKCAMLNVVLSPVGPYFKTGFKPVALYADPSFVRAWPGGAGNTKLGSNYGPTVAVQGVAEKLGLQQVLWLWGDDQKLTEVGTMNIFMVYRSKSKSDQQLHLVTPPLDDGLILPGITRASILELARHWPDVVCEERYVTIGEVEQLIQDQQLVEMFGSGTACIVCPISLIQMKDGRKLRIPHSEVNKNQQRYHQHSDTPAPTLTKRILKAVTDIQYGRVEHPWAQELLPF